MVAVESPRRPQDGPPIVQLRVFGFGVCVFLSFVDFWFDWCLVCVFVRCFPFRFRCSYSLSYVSVSRVSVVFSLCVFVPVPALVISACFGYSLTRLDSVLDVICESMLSSFTTGVFGAASEASFGSFWN